MAGMVQENICLKCRHRQLRPYCPAHVEAGEMFECAFACVWFEIDRRTQISVVGGAVNRKENP